MANLHFWCCYTVIKEINIIDGKLSVIFIDNAFKGIAVN